MTSRVAHFEGRFGFFVGFSWTKWHRHPAEDLKMKLFALSVSLLLLFADSGHADTDIRDSIVKIFCVSNSPDYDNPWNRRGPKRGHGSGCIIKGRRILTNAHVVSDHTFIQVQLNGQPTRVNARVDFISHAADLALLTVEDPGFFDATTGLELAGLPQVMDKVIVYGFPRGGDTLSTTTGVISRIEHRPYAHSLKRLLAIQIDAAINPGNSGGPAMVGDKIVGIVMQQMRGSENIGYIVPASIVRHFLDDVADGHHDGFPRIGIDTQNMENGNLKSWYRMNPSQTGVLVTRVTPGELCDGILFPGDILTKIDQHPIADDGTVEFRRNERTSFAYFIQNHQYGEVVQLSVIRRGRGRRVDILLEKGSEDHRFVSRCEYDVQPRYYIYGGLVFCPLTLNYLKTWPNWQAKAPSNLLNYFINSDPSDENEEVVIMTKVLDADINVGYNKHTDQRIVKVNGEKVINLKQMIAAIESQKAADFIVFETEKGEQLALNTQRAAALHEDILKAYGIVRDRSGDLLQLAQMK
jgi:S1-C subfamily serine protease